MRRFDPRAWNLLGSSVLLSACGPQGIPTLEGFGDVADEAETVDPDIADSVDSVDTIDPDVGGECKTAADCPPGYYCDPYGSCQPNGYTDWYTDEYTDYTDYVDWYGEETWYECYSPEECPQGYNCIYNSCQPYAYPNFCGDLPLIEIPLPPLSGPGIDLQFTDVDGDGDDDILVLGDGGVEVIRDDTVIPSPFGGAPADPLTRVLPLRLAGDGNLDVLAFPADGGEVWVGHGDGQGSFSWDGVVADVVAVGDLGVAGANFDGVDDVIAVVAGEVVAFTDFSNLGNGFMPLPVGSTNDLAVAAIDGDASMDLLLGNDCFADLFHGPDWVFSSFFQSPQFGGGNNCDWSAGWKSNQPAIFAAIEQQLLERWDLVSLHTAHAVVPEIFTDYLSLRDVDGLDFIALNHGDSLGGVYGWGAGNGCYGSLPMDSPRLRRGAMFGNPQQQQLGTLDASGNVRVFFLGF